MENRNSICIDKKAFLSNFPSPNFLIKAVRGEPTQ